MQGNYKIEKMISVSRIQKKNSSNRENLYFSFARKIWTQFMEFESTVGDLSSIKKVEKRMLASMTVSFEI